MACGATDHGATSAQGLTIYRSQQAPRDRRPPDTRNAAASPRPTPSPPPPSRLALRPRHHTPDPELQTQPLEASEPDRPPSFPPAPPDTDQQRQAQASPVFIEVFCGLARLSQAARDKAFYPNRPRHQGKWDQGLQP